MQTTVTTGAGEAARFVNAVADELTAALGFRPYPGTLNVERASAVGELAAETLTSGNLSNEHCDGVVVRQCRVAGVRGAVLRPVVPDYPDGKVELLAPVELRQLFDLADGDALPVAPPDQVWHPDGPNAVAAALDAFDAVVFDLDGTLVELDVDWQTVHEGVMEEMGDVMDGGLENYNRPELMALARETGRYDALDDLLTEYEAAGAPTSPALGLLEALSTLDCPVGVCTANALSAAERALEAHGVRDTVDVIVARGTVPEEKPHPRPLEETLAGLGVTPGNAVFVGDARTDAEAALAAGTSFLHPEQFDSP